MARGYPDYNNPLYAIAVRNIDFNLLAAIQMGITPIDARGRVYWFDNFVEGAYGWIKAGAGAAAAPYASVDRTIGRGVSLAMPTGATPETDYSQAVHLQAFGADNRFGVEVGFACGSNKSYLLGRLTFHRATASQDFRFRVYLQTGDIDIYTAAGYVFVATLGIQQVQYSWSQIKLVVDPSTGNYVRLMAGTTETDLSGYVCATGVSVYSSLLAITLQMISNHAGALTGYVSHVIMSTDEP